MMSEKAEVVSESGFDAPPTGLAAQISELEESIRTLNDLVARLTSRMVRSVDELAVEMSDKVGHDDLAAVQKELGKIESRVDEVLDEVGYGERLDPAKVPPAILEHAYQAILDDIVAELKRARGAHDLDQHIVHVLEQLRLRTSGSELFLYQPHVHRIEVGVRKPLEKGLISARQVQMTYEELERHLLEPIHYHQPRNFRALVKMKSQEFAVDRALNLTRDVDRTSAQARALGERLDRLEEHVAGALKDVQAFTSQIRDTLADVATRESVEALEMRIAAVDNRLSTIGSNSVTSVEALNEDRVLRALAGGERTAMDLRRALDVQEAVLKGALRGLESRGLVTSSLRGKTMMYRLKEETDDA